MSVPFLRESIFLLLVKTLSTSTGTVLSGTVHELFLVLYRSFYLPCKKVVSFCLHKSCLLLLVQELSILTCTRVVYSYLYKSCLFFIVQELSIPTSTRVVYSCLYKSCLFLLVQELSIPTCTRVVYSYLPVLVSIQIIKLYCILGESYRSGRQFIFLYRTFFEVSKSRKD